MKTSQLIERDSGQTLLAVYWCRKKNEMTKYGHGLHGKSQEHVKSSSDYASITFLNRSMDRHHREGGLEMESTNMIKNLAR